MHGVQSDALVKLNAVLYVPLGHKYSVPKRVPEGQYEPAGHGSGVVELDKHMLPDGQVLQVALPLWS